MQKEKVLNKEESVAEEANVKQRNIRANVIAAVICLLLAVAVWMVIMGRNDSDYVRLELRGGSEEFHYELSATVLEVEGKVADLRHAEIVRVYVPKTITGPGEYYITSADMILPKGVAPAGDFSLTLKVTAK